MNSRIYPSPPIISNFAGILLHWGDRYGRHNLPWQQDRNVYWVWVSEIMLQQTQVDTVIPYFQRFTQRFPTLSSLANAPVDDVLALWTGLGYYTRARNLHRCAQIVQKYWQGNFPDDVETLIQLPGIGRSTAGAIVSQAYNLPAPILDGNVKRVLTRYFAITGWPGQSQVEKQLWQLAQQLTPKQRNSDYTQAIMDLGATVCKRQNPLCMVCPMQANCAAFAQDKVAELPHRKPKKALPEKQVWVLLLVHNNGNILLHRRPNNGIWGGLWSLLEFSSLTTLHKHLALSGCNDNPPEPSHTITPIKHAFSHYKLLINPILVNLDTNTNLVHENNQAKWYNHKQIDTIGLPSPIKKLLLKYWTDIHISRKF